MINISRIKEMIVITACVAATALPSCGNGTERHENPNPKVAEREEQNMKDILSAQFSTDKAAAMALVYDALAPEYGREFAIGMMANIAAEGEPGQVWFPGLGTMAVIENGEDIESFISAGSAENICVGMLQWSGDRADRLLGTYKQAQAEHGIPDDGEIPGSMLAECEIEMIASELKGSWQGINITSDINAEEAAKLICRRYARPVNASAQAESRANIAARIERLLDDAGIDGRPYERIGICRMEMRDARADKERAS